MKRDKIILVMLFVVPICSGIISSYYFSKADRKVEVRQKMDVKDEIVGTNTLSIYLETAEGSGEYSLSDSDVFLTDGYYFNEDKSKCENGGALSFDKSTGKVRMSTNSSDRCYVYFDKGEPGIGKVCKNQNLAQCIKENYTIDSSIYYHNETLANGAGDNSYRYAGSHDTVKNFVCFGTDAESCPNDNLYRIIGVFDNQVKLIKYDYATKEQLGIEGDYYGEGDPDVTYYKGNQSKISRYYWNNANTSNSKNNWNESRLNTVNLNGTYLNNLGATWTDKIATTTWNVGGMTWANGAQTNAKRAYDYEVGANKINKTYEAKMGLMYLSEYYYGALPTHWTKPGYNSDATKDYSSAVNENWMYMGHSEWTISPYAYNTNRVFYVNAYGYVYFSNVYGSSTAVRPSFSLASSVELASGSGTKGDPFRIKI